MNKLIAEFRGLAIEHWYNLLEGNNVRKANRCFDKTQKIFEQIKKDNLIPEFKLLLSDPDDAVVSDAAGILLKEKYYIDEATVALKRIAQMNGMLGFNAEMCLKYL